LVFVQRNSEVKDRGAIITVSQPSETTGTITMDIPSKSTGFAPPIFLTSLDSIAKVGQWQSIKPFTDADMAEMRDRLSAISTETLHTNKTDPWYAQKLSRARKMLLFDISNYNTMPKNISQFKNAMTFYLGWLHGEFAEYKNEAIMVLGDKFTHWSYDDSAGGEMHLFSQFMKETKGTFLSAARGYWKSDFAQTNGMVDASNQGNLSRVGLVVSGGLAQGFEVPALAVAL
jgi:hypothetical protein